MSNGVNINKDRENASPLRERELFWRDRYGMLESHGYRLRQRFKPGWKPSWLTTKRQPALHEDYDANDSLVTIDAIRIADGRRVFLKRVRTSSSELRILRFLSETDKIRDSRNHTAELLDEFLDDNDTSITYTVMPFLRPYDIPSFFSVDEVVDFIKQVLEGMVYMHDLDIAHRDCSQLNIMMDAETLYPRGMHPGNLLADATGSKLAHPKRRRDVSGIRYYFIDFGISSMFGPDDERKTVLGRHGQDNEVPELSNERPYDPFCVDIFILGNLFKKSFYEKYDNMAFLDPLIDDMTQRGPKTRCKAAEALKMFNEILSQQPRYKLRCRLQTKSDGKIVRLFHDVEAISRESIFVAKEFISSSSTGLVRFFHRGLKLSREH